MQNIEFFHAATHAVADSLVSLIREPAGKRAAFYALLHHKARDLERACSQESRALGFNLIRQPIRQPLTLDGFAVQIEVREHRETPVKDDRALELSHIACLAAELQYHCFEFLDD